jgi:hypothetical protein
MQACFATTLGNTLPQLANVYVRSMKSCQTQALNRVVLTDILRVVLVGNRSYLSRILAVYFVHWINNLDTYGWTYVF